VVLWYLVSRLWALLKRPFERRNTVVPYTDRLRELIASDVDDLGRYGAYYPSTEYGALASKTSTNLRAALRRSGIRDVTLQTWADCRDAFGDGAVTAEAAEDPDWLLKLRRLSGIAAVMARGA
jgi:hypothetical protein